MNGNINWPQTERKETVLSNFHNKSPGLRGVSGPFKELITAHKEFEKMLQIFNFGAILLSHIKLVSVGNKLHSWKIVLRTSFV